MRVHQVLYGLCRRTLRESLGHIFGVSLALIKGVIANPGTRLGVSTPEICLKAHYQVQKRTYGLGKSPPLV